ncbi:MAG: orotidine 5'-phosphate decarboxylase / HUMPS family protein, partial [Nitrososphaera sp.]
IADIKLNDIDNTNSVAIDHLMDRMGFDSVIANPFIGSIALQDLVKRARKSEGGVIALVYMSHSGANEGYGLEVESGRKLYSIFLERASLADADGIVVGASNLQIIKEVSGRQLPIYSPGIGVQGGDAEAAARAGADYMIVGRSILESKNPASTALDFKERISSAFRD